MYQKPKELEDQEKKKAEKDREEALNLIPTINSVEEMEKLSEKD